MDQIKQCLEVYCVVHSVTTPKLFNLIPGTLQLIPQILGGIYVFGRQSYSECS